MSYMTLNLLKYGKNLLSTTSSHNVSSIEVAINKVDEHCSTLEIGQKIPNKIQIPMVLAADPHTLHLPTYDSAHELLTDLPGKLVKLNGIAVPAKLRHHDPDTVYDTVQIYRTLSGPWKLVCTPYQASYKGTVSVPLSSLVLLQQVVPHTAPGAIRIMRSVPGLPRSSMSLNYTP
jgi:hypothetical protein